MLGFDNNDFFLISKKREKKRKKDLRLTGVIGLPSL